MDWHYVISQLLKCGTLDADFLIRLVSAYDLDFSDILDETDSLFGDRSPSINHIIYVAYETIAREFLGTVVKHRRSRFSTTEYTIFTNYLDSHLWFDNLDLNRWFEAWRKY